MFINNINPIILSIGPLSVRYYGIAYAIGFLLAYFYLRYHIKKGLLKLTEDQLDKYFLWLIIGVVFMARLFEVFIYNAPYYFQHLSEMYRIWDGGMSFHGGLVGAIIVTYLFCRKYKIDIYDILDLLVIPGAIALMLGRIANYTNSELYGTITSPQSTPWCVVFQKVDAYCRHPTQLYESLQMLIMTVLLLSYKHYADIRKKYVKGTLFWVFVLLYGVFRFFITFLRDEQKYLGLNPGQWLCLLMVILAVIFLWQINRSANNHKRGVEN